MIAAVAVAIDIAIAFAAGPTIEAIACATSVDGSDVVADTTDDMAVLRATTTAESEGRTAMAAREAAGRFYCARNGDIGEG